MAANRAQRDGYASFWAAADQGVVSLGNFVSTILLARSLTAEEYGLYAVIFGLMLVLNNIHGSLVVYPLLIRGSRAEGSELSQLAAESAVVTLSLSVPLVAILGVTLAAMGRWDLIIVSSLALVTWQVQEAARRCFSSQLRNFDAIAGDALRYVGQVGMIAALYYNRSLTLERVLGAMTLCAVAAAVVQLVQLRAGVPRFANAGRMALTYCREGGWVLMTHIIGILSQQALPWMLAWTRGLQEAAAFQALANLAGMSHPIMFSTGNLITPTASSVYASSGYSAAVRKAMTYVGHGCWLLAPYFGALMAFPEKTLNLFYGPTSPYAALIVPLRILVIAYCLYYAAHVTGSFLNGINYTRAVSMIQLAGLAPIAAAPAIIRAAGVGGAMTALACSAAIRFAGGIIVARNVGLKSPDEALVQAAQ